MSTSLVQRVLARAAGEIGYSRWTDPKRGTKYARETQPALWPRDTWLLANGISYCDIFVTWVFWREGLLDILPAGASYNTDYRASKGGRVPKAQARPGDVLVFDWNWSTASTNHVGILEKTTAAGNPQTIEGNTSPGTSGSQSNGGGVHRRVRRWSQVRYVIRPDWAKAGGAVPALEPWESSPRIAGMSRDDVKGIQRQLDALGYDLGSYGVDGSYGRDTWEAVRAFQRKAGVSVDGVAGPETVAALKAAQPNVPAVPAGGASAPAVKPALKAPAFPLPRRKGALCYYGPPDGPRTSVSGRGLNTLVPGDVVKGSNGRWYSKGLKQWQARMKARGYSIAVDGRFGSETERIVRYFQKLVGLKVDGKIGPATWSAAWTEPVR